MKSNKQKKVPTFVIFAIFLMGVALLFYPTISDLYNKFYNYQTIQGYEKAMESNMKVQNQQLIEEALYYNEALKGRVMDISQNQKLLESYYSALSLGDNMMGYIEIDKINVMLPIYHGVEEKVLEKGVGHVEGSHLPTGEIGNHTVLTGHTGLPNATLFSNLDQLKVGDSFKITVMDDAYYYEVRNIYVVEPDEVMFEVDKEKDLVTLVTCIPYGINSHRLLVEAEQIEISAKDMESEIIQKQNENYAFMHGGLIGLLIGSIFGIVIGIGFTILVVRLLKKADK